RGERITSQSRTGLGYDDEVDAGTQNFIEGSLRSNLPIEGMALGTQDRGKAISRRRILMNQ
ncbi:MAG: hypothetical protein KGI91_16720, partial [Burkholderiales bacterium]|nr:hypothetical protein [Burkholderiales bacterium]